MTNAVVRRPRRSASGFALIAAVMLIAVAAVVVAAVAFVFVSGTQSSTGHLVSGQALHLAEAAIERAARRYATGTACDGTLAESVNNPMGKGGGFQILDVPAPVIVGGACRFRVRGFMGNSVRFLEADVQLGGGLFSEHFPSQANFDLNWGTQVLDPPPNNAGISLWDSQSNCPQSVCPTTPLVPTRSMYARTNTPSSNQVLIGYRERTLTTPIVSGAGGLAINTSVGFAKHTPNANARVHDMAVRLRDTAVPGSTVTIWFDGTTSACAAAPPPVPAACWQQNQQAFALPANRNYDRIQLFFSFQERGNNQVFGWFDAVSITSGGGAGTTRTRWVEIFP